MKHIFTISLCFLALSLSAQTEYPYPYNPDGNNDGFISLNDLMDLLSVYGTEYNAGVLATDFTSAIYYTGDLDYWDCASSCQGLQGNWKMLDQDLVGSYKQELVTQGDVAWLDYNNSPIRYHNNTALASNVNLSSWQCGGSVTSDIKSCFCQTRIRPAIEYYILKVENNDHGALMDLVENYLDSGWNLAGGVGSDYPRYYQAVWRWAE